MTLVEICLSTADEARRALAAGADRVELCADLSVGGTTPHVDTVRDVLSRTPSIDVRVMIRPRGGDFVLRPGELDAMLDEIASVRALAAEASRSVGLVFGALTGDGHVDEPSTRALVEACAGAPATFHKAIDETADIERALEAVIDCGVTRVLTSGGAPDAESGVPVLRRLVRIADGRLTVMAGGSIRPHNVARIVRATQVPEVHLRAEGVERGTVVATSAGVIREVRRALGRNGGVDS